MGSKQSCCIVSLLVGASALDSSVIGCQRKGMLTFTYSFSGSTSSFCFKMRIAWPKLPTPGKISLPADVMSDGFST